MEGLWTQLLEATKEYLTPVARILGPIAILVVGWLIAHIVASIVRRVLRRTQIDNRLAKLVFGEEATAQVEVEKWAAKGVYYLLMMFVLVAFFQAVGLTIITEPLKEMLVYVFTFAPRLLSAGILLLLAWILGRALRFVVTRVLKVAKVDQRLGESTGTSEADRVSISEPIGNAVYWLVFLVFLPAVLDALGMQGLLEPVRDMLGEAMGFLPNLLAAGLTLLVGWFAARIVQRIVGHLLAATGLDGAGDRAGLGTALGGKPLSELVGMVIYALILILAAIAALDALQFEAISGPASEMLATVLNAIPAIFIAGVVLLIAFLAGRLVGGLIADLLGRAGFDRVLVRLGLGKDPAEGERTPSDAVGYLVLVGFMLFAAIEASNLLGFDGLSNLFAEVTEFVGHVVLGLIIFGVGLYLAKLAGNVIQARQGDLSLLLSVAVRAAIVVLATAMALRQMGLANEIISLAFGLLLGALAVAVAIAFGLGGREVAGKELQRWLKSIRKDNE